MTNRWFFNMADDRVFLSARIDGEDMVGDMRSELREGGKVKNLTYDDLKQAGSGSIVIEGEKARIESDEEAISE